MDVSSGQVQIVVRKAINLLRYLELNIDTLAKEVDPEAFDAWTASREGGQGAVSEDDEAEESGANTVWKPNNGLSTVFNILGGRWGEAPKYYLDSRVH